MSVSTETNLDASAHTFQEPAAVYAFDTTGVSTTSVANAYTRKSLQLVDSNTRVLVSAVATGSSGVHFGAKLQVSSAFHTTSATTGDNKFVEGNLLVAADTVIQGNLIVEDYTIGSLRENATVKKRVGISTNNFHTRATDYTAAAVLDRTGYSTDSIITDNSGTEYGTTKVDIDVNGFRVGNVLDAHAPSNRLNLNHVYIPSGNQLQIGDSKAYNASSATVAYQGVTDQGISANTSLFTTNVASSYGRVALNTAQVDLVSNAAFTPESANLVSTFVTEQDAAIAYVFQRKCQLSALADNVSILCDQPLAEKVRVRLATLDGSIQTSGLTNLLATETEFNSYLAGKSVLGVRDIAGTLKCLNLKVNNVGQGLTPEVINNLAEMASRLQGSTTYNIMSEVALLQRSIGSLTSRLDNLNSPVFDIAEDGTSAVLAPASSAATDQWIYYRSPKDTRLSTSQATYAVFAQNVYHKFTGYMLAIGGIVADGTAVYYYNSLTGKGFFFDSVLSKWAYVEGVCLYSSPSGLLAKTSSGYNLSDDYIPAERYVSGVLSTSAATKTTGIWAFGNGTNYEVPYYGTIVSKKILIYSAGTQFADLDSIATVQTSMDNLVTNSDSKTFWDTFTDDQQMAFSGINLTGYSTAQVRDFLSENGINVANVTDAVINGLKVNFSLELRTKSILASLVALPAITTFTVASGAAAVTSKTDADLKLSTLAGRLVWVQENYAPTNNWIPMFGLTSAASGANTQIYASYSAANLDFLPSVMFLSSDWTQVIYYSGGWKQYDFVSSKKAEFLMHEDDDGMASASSTKSISFLTTSATSISLSTSVTSTDLDVSQESILLRHEYSLVMPAEPT